MIQAVLFTAPVAVKTYALSFICTPYDAGEGEQLRVMASDLSVDCVEAHVWSMTDGGHATIKVIGLTALIVVIPLLLGVFSASLSPIQTIIETRTERKCTPLMDFAISRW